MESTSDKPVEDIAVHGNFNSNEVSHVFNKYSGEDIEKISKLLLEDFKGIFLQTGPPVANSVLFQKAHFVSSLGYKYCMNLDNDLKNFIIDHLKNFRKPQVLRTPNNIFLKSLITIWEIFIEALTLINSIMDYMKSLHSEHHKLEHFDKFAIILFRNIIFQDVRVKKCFYARLSELKQVTTRDSIILSLDRLLIEDVSKMCFALKMDECYAFSIKPLFLKLTTEYFQLLSMSYLLHYSTCDYIKIVNTKLIEEIDRIQLKLDTESINEIRGIIITELVLKNTNTIVGMESCSVDFMLKNDQYDNLKHLYNMLIFVDGGLKMIFDSTCIYFCLLGSSIVQEIKESSDASTCIQSLLNLQEKFDYLMKNVFNNNTFFYDLVSNEFSDFLKLNSLMPKFLCQFIDEKLRKGKDMFIKNHTGADLHKVAFLVKHLQDKSSFEEFYHNSVAMRLLDYPNFDMKMENIMLGIFKRVVHPRDNSLFMSRIQKMCKDKFVLSKSIMNKYNEHVLVDKVILGIVQPFDLNVDILSAVFCRVVSPQSMCKVPSFAMNAFNDFYKLYSRYETKKTLKLLPQFGTAELEVTCYSQPEATTGSCDGENSTTKIERVERKINIVVSTYEMFVLDLFNSNDFLTGETILMETMIPEDSLLVSLDKLVNEHKLLVKLPNCKEIKLSDIFYVKEDL